MYYKKKIGKNGEDIALNYLKENGYEILERNFNCWWGEIDIIAKYRNEFVFVEVKTRTSRYYGDAAEAVNIIKRKHILKAIEYYLYLNKIKNAFVRIDVIEIYITNGKVKINQIKKAL